jgi:hypothetical protein
MENPNPWYSAGNTRGKWCSHRPFHRIWGESCSLSNGA